jgi:ubiquinone/menaquinone biosynthesis C-methylase UbiE
MQRPLSSFLLVLLASACATERAAERSATTTAAPRGASVKPGINKDFLDPKLEVERFVERFETESREIYSEREAILERVGLTPGAHVADIGAGTGLFSYRFAEVVGPSGKVYAVDIAQPFVERLAKGAAERGLAQLETVLCSEDDVRLAPSSIDIAFVCDTYHHFEYPAATMASIHRALRPGGELVLIDFRRIEGVSRAWTLEHVRAGEEVFTREIVAAGFERIEDVTPAGLEENYMLRFRRR